MVRLTFRPDMTLDVYRGHKTTPPPDQTGRMPRLILVHTWHMCLLVGFCCVTAHGFVDIEE